MHTSLAAVLVTFTIAIGCKSATNSNDAGGSTLPDASSDNSTGGAGGTTLHGSGGAASVQAGGSSGTIATGGNAKASDASAKGGASMETGGVIASQGGTTSETGGKATGTGGISAGTGGTTQTTVTAALGGSTSTGSGGTTTTVDAAATGGSTSLCTSFATPTSVGTIKASGINQLSGMVASRDYANTLYGQMDDGAAKIYVFDETGKTLGTIALTGITPVDWEDLSIGVVSGGTDYLYVADIGDNAARTGGGSKRTSIAVYRFPEPAPSELSATTTLSIANAQVAKFTYPGTVHDAETLFVDPTTQDMIIISKDNSGPSTVYRALSTAFDSSTTTVLEQICELTIGSSGQNGTQISAGDISATGDRVILRTYTTISLFPRLSTWALTFAATPIVLPSATEPQSEGLTFNADGTAWLSAGEQSSTIYKGVATCH
jgi:hypothetical protein